MSTDQPIPARQRQQSTSVHETEMDATGQRIWSAYGSSPGLIDLHYPSAATEFSTTRGAGSLSADIFTRWGSRADAFSTRVPLPFASFRLQRSIRAAFPGTSALASRRPASGVVDRSINGTSRAMEPSLAAPFSGHASQETSPDVEPSHPPLTANTPSLGRARKAQSTAVMRASRSGPSHSTAESDATSAARRGPLPLRAASRSADALPVSSANVTVRSDELQPAAERAPADSATNRQERATTESDTVYRSPVGAISANVFETSPDSTQIAAAPEVKEASVQSTSTKASTRAQASARQPHAAEGRQEEQEARTAASPSAPEPVSPTEVALSRVPFQPVIWRMALPTRSGSRGHSPFAGPPALVFRATANARWPWVSRTALDGVPLNALSRSGTTAESRLRVADARTERDVPHRTVLRRSTTATESIARVAVVPTRPTSAVFAVPSARHVQRVFRSAAATPALEQHAQIVSSLQGQPRLRLGSAGAAVFRTTTSGRPVSNPAAAIHEPTSLPLDAVSRGFLRSLDSRATSVRVTSLPTTSTRTTDPATVVNLARPASSSGSLASGTWVAAGTLGQTAPLVLRSPLTPVPRLAVPDGPLDSTHDSTFVSESVLTLSRTPLGLARVARFPATVMESDVNGVSDSGSPAIQQRHVASAEDAPGAAGLDTVVTAASPGPAGFGSFSMSTPLLLPKLLMRTAAPTLSSRLQVDTFSGSGMVKRTLYGTHDLALTIIGRNSTTPVNTTEAGSAPLPGFIQRSHAVDGLALTVNNPAVPVRATALSSQSPLPETSTGLPASHDVRSRAGTHGHVFVFRKQTQGGTALPRRSIETLVPPIDRMSALPMVQTEAANLPATEPRSAPAPGAHGNTDSSAQSAGGMDFEELIERVSRRLSRQLAIEHERRGAPTWR